MPPNYSSATNVVAIIPCSRNYVRSKPVGSCATIAGNVFGRTLSKFCILYVQTTIRSFHGERKCGKVFYSYPSHKNMVFSLSDRSKRGVDNHRRHGHFLSSLASLAFCEG